MFVKIYAIVIYPYISQSVGGGGSHDNSVAY